MHLSSRMFQNSFNGIVVPGSRTDMLEGQLSCPLPLSTDTKSSNSTHVTDNTYSNILQPVSVKPKPALPPLTSSSKQQCSELHHHCNCNINSSADNPNNNDESNQVSGERSISRIQNLPISRAAQRITVDSGSSAFSYIDVRGGKGGGENDNVETDFCIQWDIDSSTFPSCTGTESHLSSNKTTTGNNHLNYLDDYQIISGHRATDNTTTNTTTSVITIPTVTFNSTTATTLTHTTSLASLLTMPASNTSTPTTNTPATSNSMASMSIDCLHSTGREDSNTSSGTTTTIPTISSDYLWLQLEQLMLHRSDQVVQQLLSYGINHSPVTTEDSMSTEDSIWGKIEKNVPHNLNQV